jgi:predicted DNA-binding transcriptional regulator YafY
VNALQAYTVPVAFPGPTVEPQLLSTIAAACRDDEVLRMDYRKHDGTESTRSVEPYRLVHIGRRWYLVAWDRDRRAWRTFRVDRLQLRTPNGPRFTPREPPAEDIGEYVMRNVRSVPMAYQARVVVNAPAVVISERVPRGISVEPIDDDTCVVHASANTVEMLALYLGMLDADFTVTEPPELLARLSKLAKRFSSSVRD